MTTGVGRTDFHDNDVWMSSQDGRTGAAHLLARHQDGPQVHDDIGVAQHAQQRRLCVHKRLNINPRVAELSTLNLNVLVC